MNKNQTWNDRVRKVYSSLNELKNYDEIYGIVKRCGYKSAESLWNRNPTIGGSVNPADFGIAK